MTQFGLMRLRASRNGLVSGPADKLRPYETMERSPRVWCRTLWLLSVS